MAMMTLPLQAGQLVPGLIAAELHTLGADLKPELAFVDGRRLHHGLQDSAVNAVRIYRYAAYLYIYQGVVLAVHRTCRIVNSFFLDSRLSESITSLEIAGPEVIEGRCRQCRGPAVTCLRACCRRNIIGLIPYSGHGMNEECCEYLRPA